MFKDQGKEFYKWYDARVVEGYVFDNKKELLEYCKPNVNIWWKGCLQFHELFLNINNINLFQYS